MEFGLSFGALYAPVDEVLRLGREAEAGGFDSLWVPDSQMLYRDAYATLALLARETRGVRLGTLATNARTRHPAVTANAVLTLQELSGGRAVLGLATGDSAVRRVGERPLRLAEFERALAELRALLAGEAVAYDGGRFAIRFAAGPVPPLYVVASGPRLLELAGRLADGVVLNVGAHPPVLEAARARVAAGARAAGRPPGTPQIVTFFFCAVDPDGARARARLKPSVTWFGQHFPALCEAAGLPLDPAVRRALEAFKADYARYDLVHADRWAEAAREAAFLPDAYVERFALGGTAAEVAARLDALRAFGVDRVILRPPSTEDWVPTFRALLREVVPALRRS